MPLTAVDCAAAVGRAQRMNSKTEIPSFKGHASTIALSDDAFITRVIETSIIHGRGAEDAIAIKSAREASAR